MTVCMRSKIFDSNWIMFALHYANAIIIIIIIISKSFKNKLNTLTDRWIMFIILWKTRKIKSFFNLKDKTSSNQMSSILLSAHVGKQRKYTVWKVEHKKNSKPACHLVKHPTLAYTWNIATLRKPPVVRKKWRAC